MSHAIEIVIGRRIRQVRADELPLTVGGPDADLPLLGVESREPVALVGLSDELFFLQPHGNEPVVCNGTPVTTARWLYHDDVVRIGAPWSLRPRCSPLVLYGHGSSYCRRLPSALRRGF